MQNVMFTRSDMILFKMNVMVLQNDLWKGIVKMISQNLTKSFRREPARRFKFKFKSYCILCMKRLLLIKFMFWLC